MADNNKKRPLSKNGSPMLKMKELADRANVSKPTILLYVREGLLPKPVKTSPNMAYYDPLCVERIAFIKNIQKSHRLTLAAIKELITEMKDGGDVAPSLELHAFLFGNYNKSVKKKNFSKETGLSYKEIDELVRQRILIPLNKNQFDGQDTAIGKLLKTAFNQGFTTEELTFYPEFSEKIVDEEMRLSRMHAKGISFEKDAKTILELTHLARGIRAYIVDRLMQKKLIKYKSLEEQNKN